jgi:hypothetical protein
MSRFLSPARYVFLATALSWFVAGVESAAAAVQIIAPASALPGDFLNVQLVMNSIPGGSSDGVTSLGGFDNGTFTLSFDPDVFEVRLGNALQLSSQLPAPFAMPPASAPASIALALVYAAPLPDSTRLGVIASGQLGVKPGAPIGLTELTLRFDFNGGDIDFDADSNPLARTFQVSRSVEVIPEPSSWTMLLAGLAVTGMISRVRFRRSGAERDVEKINKTCG